jgi:hypothetical protein
VLVINLQDNNLVTYGGGVARIPASSAQQTGAVTVNVIAEFSIEQNQLLRVSAFIVDQAAYNSSPENAEASQLAKAVTFTTHFAQ